MKIGLIVYSKTGHTLEVAEVLKKELIKQQHDVEIKRVIALNDEPKARATIELVDKPSVTGYDHIIFAGFIQAFSLTPAMKLYLKQIETLRDIKVSCLLTQHFPYSWMGGNRGLKQMTKIIKAKHGVVTQSGIVHWSRKTRDEDINEVVNALKESIG